jgi:hypothetical protein
MPQTTGRFWLCPECRRHVPIRLDVCQCGFDRTKVPVDMREVSARVAPDTPRRTMSSAPIAWVIVVALVGWIGYQRFAKPTVSDAPQGADAQAPLVPAPPATSLEPRWNPPSAMPEDTRMGVLVIQRPAPSALTPPPPPPPAPQVLQLEIPQQARTTQEMEPEPEEKKERYWKHRLLQSRERVRSAFDGCMSQFHAGGLGDYGQTQYAGVRGTLVSAIMAQEELEEDARKAGVPPGWVRFDWIQYPRLEVSDPATQTGVPTVRHPCSVPDIRESLGIR